MTNLMIADKSYNKYLIILFIGLVLGALIYSGCSWFFENYYLQSPVIFQAPIVGREISPVVEDEKIKVIITPSPTEKPLESQKKGTSDHAIALVTAYSCEGFTTEEQRLLNCPNGKTATGTTPVPYKTVACDQSNLGRTFYLEGIGEVVCEDTGGAIKGSGRFDLYLPTYQEAISFGKQNIGYRLL